MDQQLPSSPLNPEFIIKLASGELINDFRLAYNQARELLNNMDVRLAMLKGEEKELIVQSLREAISVTSIKMPQLKIELASFIEAKHKNLPLAIAASTARIPIWLYGDAGSGKSTAAEQIARLLDTPFGFISVCPTTSKSELFGYKDGHGTYHDTIFRNIYENGGVFLIDEIDNGNPGILSVLNNALASSACAFPDGIVKKHQNFIIMAAANTIGHGGNIKYVGRNPLDATTLDRFVFVEMNIDENLEKNLLGIETKEKLVDIFGDGCSIAEWHGRVLKARKKAQEIGVNHLVTPRAAIYGAKLLSGGVSLKHVDNMCLRKGLEQSIWDKIKTAL